MMYLNNLGEFSSLADVWKAYPYGGKEGDYVTINGEKIGWNKYSNRWGDDEETSLPMEEKVFDGDVTVNGRLRVLGAVDIPIDNETIVWQDGKLRAPGGGNSSPDPQVTANTKAIEALNADANTKGSVDYKVNNFQWLEL